MTTKFEHVLEALKQYLDAFSRIRKPKDFTVIRVLNQKLMINLLQRMGGYEDLEKYAGEIDTVLDRIEEDHDEDLIFQQWKTLANLGARIAGLKATIRKEQVHKHQQ